MGGRTGGTGWEGGKYFGHGVDRGDWTDSKWTDGWGGTQYKDELVYWSQLQFAEDLFPRLTATEAGNEGWLVGIPKLSPELHSVEKPPSHLWAGLPSSPTPFITYILYFKEAALF